MEATARTTGSPVFFIGDVALDEYYTADRWPGPGDKVMVETRPAQAGGMIANAASVHAALGGETEFISLLNTGDITQRLQADLEANGVRVSHMLFDATMPDSKTIIVLVGDEHVVLIPELGDAPMRLPDETFRELCQDGYLYSSIWRVKRLRATERDALAVLDALHTAGRRLILDLDVDGFTADDLPFLAHARAVIMNDRGFRRSFDAREPDDIQAWLQEWHIDMLVVTHGAGGLTAFVGESQIEIAGLQVPVVDVTGAGDTFGGALTFALGRAADLRTALSFANSAAAYAVTRFGPRGGVALVGTVLDFMETHAVPECMAARKQLAEPGMSG